MEDFDDEEFNELVKEGIATQTAQAANNQGPASTEIDKDVSGKHQLLMDFGGALVARLVKESYVTPAMINDKSLILTKIKSSYPKEEALIAELEGSNLTVSWVIKRLRAGWNAGNLALTYRQLNGIACLNGQVETIPFTYEGKSYLYVNKCRYSSVAYLPGTTSRFAYMLYRYDGKEMVLRDPPPNLITAYAKSGKPWKLTAPAGAMLTRAIAFMKPALIFNVGGLVATLGENVDRLKTLASEISLDPVANIEPYNNKARGIFDKCIDVWTNWFEGFAYDDFGKVTVARALAALPVRAYLGTVSDVPYWKAEPSTFKCPTHVTTFIPHSFIDYNDRNSYPTKYLAYNPTPAELNFFINFGAAPVALALPLTSAMSNAPQVEKFCQRFARVSLIVVASDPPIMVFGTKDDNLAGLDGRTVRRDLPLLEKAIVRGFIELVMEQAKGNCYHFFSINDLSQDPSTLDIKINIHNMTLPVHTTRYVSVSDKELSRGIPTARVADVTMEGQALFATKKRIVPTYPRGVIIEPPAPLLKAGDTICADGSFIPKVKAKLLLESWCDDGEVVFVVNNKHLTEVVLDEIVEEENAQEPVQQGGAFGPQDAADVGEEQNMED